MPYTTVSQITPDQGSGATEQEFINSYFHPEDIEIVLNQPGANAVQIINAVIGIDRVETITLIGVNVNAQNVIITRLLNAEHLIALICPPFTNPGGRFEPNPRL